MSHQRLTIDLKKNPDVAKLVADLEPSDYIYAELCIVSKDEQSLVVEIEATGETASDLEGDETESDESDDGDEPESKESDGMDMKKDYGAGSMGNS